MNQTPSSVQSGWPSPPSITYQSQGSQQLPLDCEMEGLNGSRRFCLLTGLDLPAQTAQIYAPSVSTVLSIAFSQFRCITLKQMLYPVAHGGDVNETLDEWVERQPWEHYRMQMNDGTQMDGHTMGHVDAGGGVFLFPLVQGSVAVKPQFIPRLALRELSFGAAIAPVQGHRVVQPAQLIEALEQQGSMPMARTGDALLDMGLINQSQMEQALQAQKAEPASPSAVARQTHPSSTAPTTRSATPARARAVPSSSRRKICQQYASSSKITSE